MLLLNEFAFPIVFDERNLSRDILGSASAEFADLFFLLADRCVARIDLHVWRDYYREYAWNSIFATAIMRAALEILW